MKDAERAGIVRIGRVGLTHYYNLTTTTTPEPGAPLLLGGGLLLFGINRRRPLHA